MELPRLYQAGVLRISAACYENLLRVSPATMDRLRTRYRPRQGQRRGFTQPGTLLKQRIPVRTWADCTERVAVRNKAQVHVFAAIQRTHQCLPFPLLGLDSDTGTEFINDHLYRYCLNVKITFTRGRAGRKNDNAYVEQKNWSVVRCAVGYWPYDSPEQLELLDRLYVRLHLYVNVFLLVVKLQEKARFGSKMKLEYNDPQTPYARVLASPSVSEEDKAELREAYGYLDLIELRRSIDDLQVQLLRTLSRTA